MHNDLAKRIAANRRQAARIEKELCARTNQFCLHLTQG